MDLDTREWSDGILTSASREAVKDTSKPVWIICDGDIDPEWIEALNSVLDDNKLVCLRFSLFLSYLQSKITFFIIRYHISQFLAHHAIGRTHSVWR